jgi:hypothetical protein
MNTRVIQREFIIRPGGEVSTPVSLDGRWSSFMNTYAVWDGNSDSTTIRRALLLGAGHYWILGAADNSGTVSINGTRINLYNFNQNISRTDGTLWPGSDPTLQNRILGTTPGPSTRIYHPGGAMSVVINATNAGGPRGVAVTISADVLTESARYAGDRAIIVNNIFKATPGALVWSTRQPGTLPAGRFLTTMPFRAEVTAYAWGGGGGGGGLDPEGGVGAPGLYNTGTFEVQRGDVLEVFVGSGGQYGRTTVRVGGSPGGPGGDSRLNVGGNNSRSFNGGTGGSAGLGGWSGGGGGGGGASGVLVNDNPVLVAGGGGGGAGGGSYRDANAGRQQASITNNATGDYAIGVKALNIDSAGSLTLSAQTQIVESNAIQVPQPPSASGSTKVLGFGYGLNVSGSFTRTVRTNNKVNLATSSSLTFYVRRDTRQTPDNGEDLHLEYSTNGSTWVNITSVPYNITANTWLIRSPQIPAGAKVAGGVFLRYRQTVTGSSNFTNKDLWAMTSVFNGSPSLDFRGEDGQIKGPPDGGGGGGGGGGYPGGQGGAVHPGDTPGFAGQCGGNFPDNVGVTTGTDSPYYKAGYGGGANYSASAQNGRVFLLIKPIGLGSVKLVDQWRQISEGFVKISGDWKDIDAVYIKINNSWREVRGSGQKDITLAASTDSYGRSGRGYS